MKTIYIYVLAFIGAGVAWAEESADNQCGLQGSVTQRIADCAEMYPTDSSMTTTDDRGERDLRVIWRLVSVMNDGRYSKVKRQVWLNDSTNLIWSDRIVFGKSGGYVSHAEAMTLCQSDERSPASKGSINLEFRLPTIEEFREAHAQELRDVLPGVSDNVFNYTGSEISSGGGTTALHRGFAFWTSDTETDERGRRFAWVYDAFPFPLFGEYFYREKISNPKYTPGKNVMCVAKVAPTDEEK